MVADDDEQSSTKWWWPPLWREANCYRFHWRMMNTRWRRAWNQTNTKMLDQKSEPSLLSLLQPKELNNLIAIRFSFLSLFMLFFLLCATEFFYSLNIFDWRGPSEHPASFTRHKAYTHYPNLKRCSFPPLRTARPTDRRCSFSSPLKVLQFFGSLLKPYSCTI